MPEHAPRKAGHRRFRGRRRERASDAAIAPTGGLKCPHATVATERRSGSKEDDGRKEPCEKHVAFATNDPDMDVDAYSKRWGTGTNYRMLESARVKTRSNKHGPRVTCVAIATMLSSAWVLACALAGLASAASFAGPAIKPRSALVAMTALVWVSDACPGPPPVAP